MYTSMIDKGLRYGVISTGARYVLVTIDPDNLSVFALQYMPPVPVDGHRSVAANAHRIFGSARAQGSGLNAERPLIR